MRPLIGISACLDERGRWREGRRYQYLDAAYADAVSDAGGVPLLLPIQADADAALARLSGLLLPGGDDFAPPQPYPAQVHFDLAPARQLEFDGRLLERATARGLPVLAICYGAQLLALQAGGSLHYDLPTDVPGAASHRLPEASGRHPLEVMADSRLARILGAEPEPVNSLHHQAIATPGSLAVGARSPDGLIEAVERSSGPFCMGVQWHPEKLTGAHRERLFGAFVAACAGAERGHGDGN